jgi:hypothetical protein
VGFVVDKVALGQVFSEYSGYSYALDGRDLIPNRGKRFIFFLQRSDRLWDLYSGYRRLFPPVIKRQGR